MTPAEDAVTSTSPTPGPHRPDSSQPVRVLADRELDRDIPYGVRIAAAWAWRVGLILLVGGALVWLLSRISFLIIPVMVAALLAGLLSPVVRWLKRYRVPAGAAVAITVVGLRSSDDGSASLLGNSLDDDEVELWLEIPRVVTP